MGVKFQTGEVVRANDKAPSDYADRVGVIIARVPGRSEYGIRFDDGGHPHEGYLDSGWLERPPVPPACPLCSTAPVVTDVSGTRQTFNCKACGGVLVISIIGVGQLKLLAPDSRVRLTAEVRRTLRERDGPVYLDAGNIQAVVDGMPL